MLEEKQAQAVLRPKRQLTIPREICEQLDIKPGDVLELSVEGSNIVAKPKKVVALEALREVQEAFRRSGITEKELQEAGRRVRRQVNKERNAGKR